MPPPRIDIRNAGLMLLAAAVAWLAPLPTFASAYLILGPLHYVTELSWLHDRGFYARGRFDFVPLSVLAVMIAACQWAATSTAGDAWIAWVGVDLMFVAFGVALLVAVTASLRLRLIGLAGIVTLALALREDPVKSVVFAVFLPTVIHVAVFTLAFVLHGALRHGSLAACLSLAVYGLCVFALLWSEPSHHGTVAGGTIGRDLTGGGAEGYHFVAEAYASVAEVHRELVRLLDLDRTALPGFAHPLTPVGPQHEWLGTLAGVRISRLLAFAYTYHYLNWFSKTSVIRWHEVSLRRWLLVIGAWLGSLVLCVVDLRLGLRIVLLLGLLHVLLEFPLNHLTLLALARRLLGASHGRFVAHGGPP